MPKIPERFLSQTSRKMMKNPVRIYSVENGRNISMTVDRSEVPDGLSYMELPQLKNEILKWQDKHGSDSRNAGSSESRFFDGDDFDLLFKFRIIGDSGVGKSCLLLRHTDDSYTEKYISTIGVDFKVSKQIIDDKKVKLQIWDTAGQDNFRAIQLPYGHHHHGIILCYDVSDQVSFNNLKQYLSKIKEQNSEHPSIIIVGNKCDLTRMKVVEYNTAKEFADSHNLTLIEASAKTGENVDAVFRTLAQQYMKRMAPTTPVKIITQSSEQETPRPKDQGCNIL